MQLAETTLADPATGFSRTVWRRAAHDGPRRRTCIVLDAELYLERVEAAEVIDGLTAAGRLPALNWVFVSNLDAEARHHDFTCNGDYARFVTQCVLPAGAGAGNLICGLSLSGLASAHIALSYPQLFSGALCQSGSFWWNGERFTTIAKQLVPQTGGPELQSRRFWLSVGSEETEEGVSHPPTGMRQEVSQLASVARAAQTLQGLGCTVEHRIYDGGHDPVKWKDELQEALTWLTS